MFQTLFYSRSSEAFLVHFILFIIIAWETWKTVTRTFFKNFSLCVSWKKESHTDLKQNEDY